jgi:hypothetical protein
MAAVEKDLMALQEERRRAEGVAASLQQPVFDQELYGSNSDRFAGYDRSIGLADTEEEMDEREQAVRRCVSLHVLCSFARLDKLNKLLHVSSWLSVGFSNFFCVLFAAKCSRTRRPSR